MIGMSIRGQFLKTVVSLTSKTSLWRVCYRINTCFCGMSTNLDFWRVQETGPWPSCSAASDYLASSSPSSPLSSWNDPESLQINFNDEHCCINLLQNAPSIQRWGYFQHHHPHLLDTTFQNKLFSAIKENLRMENPTGTPSLFPTRLIFYYKSKCC